MPFQRKAMCGCNVLHVLVSAGAGGKPCRRPVPSSLTVILNPACLWLLAGNLEMLELAALQGSWDSVNSFNWAYSLTDN